MAEQQVNTKITKMMEEKMITQTKLILPRQLYMYKVKSAQMHVNTSNLASMSVNNSISICFCAINKPQNE